MRLPIIHWNDVYRVAPQKIAPNSKETIDVTQFSAKLDGIRDRWESLPDGSRMGLTLFSGDVFSPSVESSVTRGSHMVPVMNVLAPDVSLTGNHDFDFGYPHLSTLIKDTKFPWILSNIVDVDSNTVPDAVKEFIVLERGELRIGIIGLVEQEWIGTVANWPHNFEYRDMKETGLKLSQQLRDPNGDYRCDLIIALTHSRIPNDIKLAKDLLALSPSAQKDHSVENSHGVDLLLGGHDHLYFISKGVTSWINYDLLQEVLGAEEDNGDVLVVKSGTDFRDLSELILDLESTPPSSVRRMVIKAIEGTRHFIQPGSPSSQELSKVLKRVLSSVSASLKAPVCNSTVPIDVRSQFVRTAESASGNWFADVIRHAYDDTLCMRGCGGSDGVFICGGTLRGDSVYGPGVIAVGDILEILPFEDPIVVLELEGAAIWDALEASLSTWPAQEGRFPIISGFRVSWDSRRQPGHRVLGVWLLRETEESIYESTSETHTTPHLIDGAPIERRTDGRKYKIVTREYMAQGHDGFTALQGKKYLIDDENGQTMSSIVRRYLLGSHFVNKMARAKSESANFLQQSTQDAIAREINRQHGHARSTNTEPNSAVLKWKHAARAALHFSRSKTHYRDQLRVCGSEHMSAVDSFDGENMRRGNSVQHGSNEADEDLLSVSPQIDGRLKDEGRL